MLYWAKISGERLQDHWSSGLVIVAELEVDHLEKQLQSADNKLIEIESEKETT